MARMINWNPEPFIAQCRAGGMERLEEAAWVLVENMQRRLTGMVREQWREHGPYRRFRQKIKRAEGITYGQWVKYGTESGMGSPWTARYHGELAKTIRVVPPYESRHVDNIWIMAGNRNVWWALQTEYGHGQWKGGRKSFFRPVLQSAPGLIRGILEGGALGQEII